MTHSYKITGMTCDSCQAKVQKILAEIEGVTDARVNWRAGEAEITMQKHISTPTLQAALKGTKYQIAEIRENIPHFMGEETKSWLQTYKPVLLLFVFITGISFLVQIPDSSFSWMRWMQTFMAGFFLAFSFFKILNLQGFADSYSTYDIIAKRWRAYGFIYAFIELSLGIAFLTNFQPVFTNATTFVVMSVSLVGVLQSVLNKRKIR
ncbi:MAG TPA: cation transporter, partial [Bacteroidia bacterium]